MRVLPEDQGYFRPRIGHPITHNLSVTGICGPAGLQRDGKCTDFLHPFPDCFGTGMTVVFATEKATEACDQTHPLPVQRIVVQQPVGHLGLRPAPARQRDASRRLRRQIIHQSNQPPRPPGISQLQCLEFLPCPTHLYALQHCKSFYSTVGWQLWVIRCGKMLLSLVVLYAIVLQNELI